MNYLKLLSLCVVSGIFISGASAADDPAANWQTHMRKLSDTLVNAFPFLYSKVEFKKPGNKDVILSALKTLANTGHTLPVKSGQALIGAEPLIEAASFNIKGQVDEAIRLYDLGDFEASQTKIHSAIQNCFACHTAHQIGPQFPTTNNEVMGLATSNILGKAVVFGSLRQFDGALELIERDGGIAINKKAPSADNLVKLYMIVSLRSQQNFKRATGFLKRYADKKPGPVISKWLNDIKMWQTLTVQGNPLKIEEYIAKRKKADPAAKDDSLFVVYLLESFFLHNQPDAPKSRADKKALAFQRLAEVYEGLNFSPFETLPETYYRACAKVDSGSAIGHACQAKIARK